MTQRDGMGGRREEGSGWGTHVYLWQIHFDIWQNQYIIVKLKNKIKKKNTDLLDRRVSVYYLNSSVGKIWLFSPTYLCIIGLYLYSFTYFYFGGYTPINWRRKWQPTPVFLPRESHGRRSLVGYSPCGCKESDTTERLHLHFHVHSNKLFVVSLWFVSALIIWSSDRLFFNFIHLFLAVWGLHCYPGFSVVERSGATL